MNPSFQILSVFTGCLLVATIPSQAATILLVSEDFGGAGNVNLGGTLPDTFHADIVAAGGSATWAASTLLKANGSFTINAAAGSHRSGRLNLGSYINDAKGESNGLFELTATIRQPSAQMLTFGFSSVNTPAVTENYATVGAGTMGYRSNGDIDMFLANATEFAPDDVLFTPGPRTMTITLDLRNHDGTTNFGSISFGDSVEGSFGTHTFTSDINFGAILLSTETDVISSGRYDSLMLTQIPEPSAALLGSLGLLALLRRRRA